MFDGQGNSGDCGIYVGSGASYGKIGKNQYLNLTAAITNNSTTTNVEYDVQHGTFSFNTTTAEGDMYNGGGYVTFPIAFKSVVGMYASVTNGNGWANAGVTTDSPLTHGYVHVRYLSNGVTVSGTWTAYGIL